MAKYFVLLLFLGLTFMCPSYSQTDKTFRFSHIGLSEGLSQSTLNVFTTNYFSIFYKQ